MSKMAKIGRATWRSGADEAQMRRVVNLYDPDQYVDIASPSPDLLSPDAQRIPIAMFNSYDGTGWPGWVVRYSADTGQKEFRDPTGRIWVQDTRDPSYLVMLPKAPPDEPPKLLDRFAGLDI